MFNFETKLKISTKKRVMEIPIDEWVELTYKLKGDVPTGRTAATGAVLNDKFIFFGGRQNEGRTNDVDYHFSNTFKLFFSFKFCYFGKISSISSI